MPRLPRCVNRSERLPWPSSAQEQSTWTTRTRTTPAERTYEQAVRDVRKATERFPSLRIIPAETPEERLRVGHVAYDIRAAQKDINVIFPLTRLRERVQEGVIGSLAPRSYSYHGLTNIPRLMQESAPAWAQMLKDDGVDAVFLTAG